MAIGPTAVRSLRKFVQGATEDVGLPALQRNHLMTALSEFCNNIVKHAKPPATLLKAELSLRDGDWMLEIIDNGGEYNPLTSGRFEPLNTGNSALRESGMGIALIATCYPSCAYVGKTTAPDRLNHLHIPLGPRARTE
jgi:anti-sigma regulatory factor (Ser/Thr protein kinase)